jgi:hypothetical protein
MDRVVLYTDYSSFERDVKAYGNRTQVKQDIKAEMKKLLPKYKVTDDFFIDIDLNFYNAIEEAYPEHIKLMKAHKVPEMIDMDISKLMKLSSDYEAVKHNKNVSISAYEVLAETEQEIKEFKAVESLIKALQEFEKETETTISANGIMHCCKGWLSGATSAVHGADYLKYNYQIVSARKNQRK